MPYIDPGNGDLARNLMLLGQMLQERKQRKQATLAGQANNLLQLAQPGSTVGSLGLTPDQEKAAFGQQLDPNTVVKEQTPEHVLAGKLIPIIESMPPDVVNVLAASRAATSSGAPAGLYTAQGVVNSAQTNAQRAKTARTIEEKTAPQQVETAQAQAQSSATQAQSVAQAVEAGAAAFAQAPQRQRELVGMNITFGKTPNEVESQDVQARLKTEANRIALGAALDPQHSPLAKELAKVGVSLPAAIGAAVFGVDQLIGMRVQRDMAASMGKGQVETAMQKQEAEVAGTLAKQLGASPRAVLNEMNNQLAGKPANGPLGLAIRDGMSAVRRAYIQKAVADGSPTAQAMQSLIDMYGKIKDPDQLEAVGKLINMQKAELELEGRFGPPPDPTDPRFKAWVSARNTLSQSLVGTENQSHLLGLFGNPFSLTGTGDQKQQAGASPQGAGTAGAGMGINAPGLLPQGGAGAQQTPSQSQVSAQQPTPDSVKAAAEQWLQEFLKLKAGTP